MLKKLRPCLRGYERYSLLAPLMVSCEVVLEVFMPLLMSRIIDIGIANGDVGYVVKIGGLMVVMALLSLLFGALSARFAALAGTGLANGIRKRVFHKIQDFSFANVDKFSTASLITRLTTDVTNTQNAFMMIIRMLVRAPFMMVSATVMAVSINAKLAGIFLIAIPLLGAALGTIAIKAHPRFEAMLRKYDGMNAFVQENLLAIRVVKSFVLGGYEDQQFKESTDELRQAQLRAERIVILNNPIMMLTMYTCTVAVAWLGGRQIIAGHMLTGQFFSFISYISQILSSLMMISMAFIGIVLSRASVLRIIQVLDEGLDIKDSEDSDELQVQDGSIVFDHVSFSYAKRGDNLTLEGINLEIKSGETVGIIGGTGSAKTTLVQLIPRLYDVFAGRILVGGHDVKRYRLATLRNSVAMVLQKNTLFSGTIKDNLRWGNAKATDEEIVAACKAAQAHDFILSLPNGYETDLGQGGVNLSGGQKQRICIARALLKRPKIIILDDSTSAVDTATDSKIRQAFKHDLTETTTIIIAQRITSVWEADKIIVMNDGQIDGVGTHQELLQNNQIYREVYESQQKGVA